MSADESRESGPTPHEFPKLSAFESALAALEPRAAEIDREALFFAAGRAAALRDENERRSPAVRWSWPLAFSAMTAVAAMLLVMLLHRPAPVDAPAVARLPPAVPIVEPQVELHPADSTVAAYSHLRDELLRHGIDAGMPPAAAPTAPVVAAAGPLTYRELLAGTLRDM